MPMQINLNASVNNQSIRRETLGGREHIVLPSYTLPAGVIMNEGLYPASEIDAHYTKLEGTLAPLGHPTLDGAHISAFRPEAINSSHIGAFNRNVKKAGHRIFVEKWVDTAVANQSEQGREFLQRVADIEAGKDVPPIHTSAALFLDQMPAPEGAEYKWIAKIHDIDHDAILLHEVGAATPEQGVGLMVNTEHAQILAGNAGVLGEASAMDRKYQLQSAAIERFAPGENQYLWVEDWTADKVIIVRNGGLAEVFGYTIENGKVVFSDSGISVERRESWVAKVNKLVSKLPNLFGNRRPQSGITLKGNEVMPMTAEEKAELQQSIGTVVANAVTAALEPINKELSELKVNQAVITDQVTANSKAAEAEKRAIVAAKFSEVVANSLSGAALDEMVAKCGTAANLNTNNAATQPGQKPGGDFAQAID